MSVMTMLNKRGKGRPNTVQGSQIIWDLEKAGYDVEGAVCCLFVCIMYSHLSWLLLHAQEEKFDDWKGEKGNAC